MWWNFHFWHLTDWLKKLLAATPRGYWHHGYIKLLRGTDRTGLQASQKQGLLFGWKKNFTDILFLPVPPTQKKNTNSCALYSNYTLLSVFSAPVSSIFPRFSCLRCKVPFPRREGEPLVLPEWTILSRIISKGSGKPLYCQRTLLWQLHLLNQARKLFIHF